MPNEKNEIKQVMLDVNVCIDLIVNRSLSPVIKRKLFAILILNKINGYISAFSIDTIFYILNSSMKIDKDITKNAIQNLLNYTKLCHTTDEIIKRSFTSNFSDYEDGIVNTLAENKRMDAIITSNISDFKKSSLPIYRPEDFVALFEIA